MSKATQAPDGREPRLDRRKTDGQAMDGVAKVMGDSHICLNVETKCHLRMRRDDRSLCVVLATRCTMYNYFFGLRKGVQAPLPSYVLLHNIQKSPRNAV